MLRVLHRAGPFRPQCIHRPSYRLPRHTIHPRRGIVNVPTVLLPPLVFSGLVVALWTWKCLMMIVFQNKIIYMPGLPPNARRETIADYKNQTGGIQWKEEKIKSGDGTQISLCVASVDSGLVSTTSRKVYILYFQGNASSLPPRLPLLSPILRALKETPSDVPAQHTMVCCSYRGYWTSSGRPSEKGIALDAIAALNWVQEDAQHFPSSELVIWGQSIGAGVATNLAAQQGLFAKGVTLKTLVLETPFLSIKAMLETLYPEKWLPYRYLYPFLRNHLDSWTAVGQLQAEAKSFKLKPPNILILKAGKDELVPASHGDMLEKRCVELGLEVKKQVISGALHTEVMVRSEGRLAILRAIR